MNRQWQGNIALIDSFIDMELVSPNGERLRFWLQSRVDFEFNYVVRAPCCGGKITAVAPRSPKPFCCDDCGSLLSFFTSEHYFAFTELTSMHAEKTVAALTLWIEGTGEADSLSAQLIAHSLYDFMREVIDLLGSKRNLDVTTLSAPRVLLAQ